MPKRETMKQAGYTYGRFDHALGGHILIDKDGKRELWVANRFHASYGIIFKNTHLEFVRFSRKEPQSL